MNFTKLAFTFLFIFTCFFQQAPIAAGSYTCNGSQTSAKEIRISTNIFKGTGTLRAPYINIICDEFQFVGTICCSESCIIRTAQKFDYNLFKREGLGSFIIIIGPNELGEFKEIILEPIAEIRREI